MLNHSNIGFESALKSVEYFYNELFEIYTNRPSQFEGKILVRGNHISYTQNDKILLEICSNKTNLAFGGIVIINHEYIYYSDQINVINNVSFKYFITSFLNFGEVLALVSNTRNTKSIKSFDSKLTDIQLEALYKALINEYIHSETTLEQFKAVFTAQPVETITKIDWLKEPVLLAYFIDNLFDKKYIRRHSKKWKMLDIVFTKAENLKQITENYKNNQRGQPLNHSEIDKLIDLL